MNYFKGKTIWHIPHSDFTGVVACYNGDIVYYLDGAFHRENGPACEFANGDKEWWLNGKCHREDGPAAELTGRKQWLYNDEFISDDPDYTLEDFQREIKLRIFK